MNSRSFALALRTVLDRHVKETGIKPALLLADQDSKFTRSFAAVLRRRGIRLRYAANAQKNVHIERVVGQEIKRRVAAASRTLKKSWPTVLGTVVNHWNRKFRVHGSNYAPLDLYKPDNFSKFMEEYLQSRPYLERALYPTRIALTASQAESIYKFALGETVLADLTPIKRSLRGPFPKISEQRTPVWSKAEIIGRKLVETSANLLLPRYHVRLAKTGRRAWYYDVWLKNAPAASDETREALEEASD